LTSGRLFCILNSMDETNQVAIDRTNGSTALLELEGLIKQYLSSLENLKKELKSKKEMIDDSFSNDAVYKEQDEKAKADALIKNSTKMQILKTPSLVEVKEKVDELRAQIKEAEENLSDYLLQYQKLTGFNEIEVNGGETMIIVSRAKLVKGSSQK